MRSSTHFRALLIGIFLTGTLGAAKAADEWKLGTVGAPGSGLLRMGEMVAEGLTKAGGSTFVVRIQSVANEQEMVQQVIRGRLEVGATSPQGLGAGAPDASVLAFPFLWRSNEERNFVMENYAKPVLGEILAEKGLHLLTIADAGYYGVFCQFDCRDPASLKNVKVRVSPTAPSKLFWDTIGASPVQLPLSEFWPALEQNLVRAGDIPLPFYVTTPAAQSAPFYINTNHFHAAWVFFVNKQLWDKLKDSEKKAIADNLPPVKDLLAVYDKEVSDAKARHESRNGKYVELTPELNTKWRGDVEQKLPTLLESMGPGAKKLFAAIQQGKSEFAKKK